MPSLDPSTFGPEYEALIHRAFSSHHPLPIVCLTEKQANSLRHRIYAFFRALKSEGMRLDLIEKANGLTVSSSGKTLYLLHKRDSWDHVAIREALTGTVEAYRDMTDKAPPQIGQETTRHGPNGRTSTPNYTQSEPSPQNPSFQISRQSSHEARMARLIEIRSRKD